MIYHCLHATAPQYLSELCTLAADVFSEKSAVCTPKWTDGATPQTVQHGLACFQCRSTVGLAFFGRPIMPADDVASGHQRALQFSAGCHVR